MEEMKSKRTGDQICCGHCGYPQKWCSCAGDDDSGEDAPAQDAQDEETALECAPAQDEEAALECVPIKVARKKRNKAPVPPAPQPALPPPRQPSQPPRALPGPPVLPAASPSPQPSPAFAAARAAGMPTRAAGMDVDDDEPAVCRPVPTGTMLEGLSIAQLKAKCEAKGLKVSGRKDELIARLEGWEGWAVEDCAPTSSSQRGPRGEPTEPLTTPPEADLEYKPGMIKGLRINGTHLSDYTLGRSKPVRKAWSRALLNLAKKKVPPRRVTVTNLGSKPHPSSMRNTENAGDDGAKRARTEDDEQGTEGPGHELDPHNEGEYPDDQELQWVKVSNGMDQCGVSHGPTPARELTGYCTQVPNSGRSSKWRGRRRGRPRSRPSR